MKALRKMLIVVLGIFLATLAALWILLAVVHTQAAPRVYTRVADVPPAPVALVLGAGLERNGSPTSALRDRVETAVDLYKAGKVKKLLMSGDNRFVNYNEPGAMNHLAVQLGVPAEDIVLDYAGRRTYDSCYRVKEVFEVDQVIVVTQRFHLDRSIFLCDAMGIRAVGVVADRGIYGAERWWEMREVLATAAAWWDVNVRHPVPVLGEKLPIHMN
jgi:SanA protein